MNVTIISDASHCSKLSVGGYGYWIVCERGSLPGGGPLKGEVRDSTIAEMMGVCKALDEAARAGLVQTEDHVLIQTDSRGAIAILQSMRPTGMKTSAFGRAAEPVVRIFVSMCDRLKLHVRFKHVKGHTQNDEPRFAANRMCDMRARAGLKEARKLARSVEKDLPIKYEVSHVAE